MKVDVTNCHACHAKRRWISPSAMPALQNEGACRQVPPLPRKVPRRQTNPGPSAPPSATSATPATQNEGACHHMPRLPCKTKVDVTKCDTCHTKRRCASPSAMPATQSTAASPATNPGPSAPKRAQARHQVQQVPRLPRKTKVHVTKCDTCHTKRRCASPSAMPATQSTAASDQSRPKRATKCNKCHVCHAKRRWMSPNATPATPATPAEDRWPVKRRWMPCLSCSHVPVVGKDVCERWWVTKLCVKDGV